MLDLKNYKAFPEIPRGGVVRTCTFVRNDYFESVKMLSDIMNKDTCSVWIGLKCEKSGKEIAIGNFYREWSRLGLGRNSIETQIQDLTNLESQVEKCFNFDNLILGGDWNIDMEKYKRDGDNFDKKTLAEFIESFRIRNGLNHIEFGPTRFGNETQEDSALDFFLIKKTDSILEKENTDDRVSADHNVISVTLDLKRKQIKSKKIEMRKKLDDKISASIDLAAALNGAGIIDAQDADDCAERLDDVMESFLNKHYPKITKTIREGINRKFDPEIEELKKVKKKLAKYYNLTGNARIEKERECKRIKNKINSLVKKKERDRVYEQLDKNNVWKVVKNLVKPNQIRENIKLIHEGAEMTDPEKIANVINNYYIEKIKGLVDGIEPALTSDPYEKLKDYMKDRGVSFKFQKIGTAEVSKIIKKMRKTNAAGVDEVSINMIKEFEVELIPYLVHIINRVIMSNNFPKRWKIAKVLPLFKNKGQKTDKKNYRPVSNLITFSKILESVLEKQLRDYFEGNNLILNCQYGFRKVRGTNMALLEATSKWKELKSQKNHIGICLFDLSAAFDCLDKDILDEKLKIYGVDFSARKLIKSYLTGRYQIVEVDGKISTMLEISTGSPQGSVLSPLLYIIFCGDLRLWINSRVEAITFADDTTIFCGNPDEQIVTNTLEEESLRIFEYFSSNKLVANKDKTAFIFVNKSRSGSDDISRELNVADVKIVESSCDKLLGLKIDKNLDFKEQVKDVQNKINHNLYQLRKIRPKISDKQLKIIGQGTVMSKISYAASAYANSYLFSDERLSQVDNNKKLQRCQNDFLRVITKNTLSDQKSVREMLEETELKSVNQIIASQQLMSGWSIMNNEVQPLKSMISGNNSTVNQNLNLRSASNNLIRPDYQSFSSYPNQLKRLWNHDDLPSEFRFTQNKSTAKRLVNSFVSEFVPKIPWKRHEEIDESDLV